MRTRFEPAAEDDRRPALPSDHVFVVQFRERSRAHRLGSAGRVEHLRSGEATHFATPEELLAFTRGVLRRLNTGRGVGRDARAGAVPPGTPDR